jgi:Flp pilus assembly pilin Flp
MMPYWKAAVMKWFADQSGQDMVEYALVAGFVAVAAGAIFPATLMPDISMLYSRLDIYLSASASQGS